jgi:cobalt-zinc-cadmium efflux system outer membrane protein
LEKAKRIPDPTISLGVRRFEESDDNAFVAGLSIPLPVFNRNQGGVAEARAELARSTYERDGAVQRLRRMLGTTYAELRAAYQASRTLQEDVLPGAEHAYEAAETGFRAGKFNFLDVLDAERTLFSARRDLLEQQAAYQRARITTDRLVGRVAGAEPALSKGAAR